MNYPCEINDVVVDTVQRVFIRMNRGWDHIMFSFDDSKNRGSISIQSTYGNWACSWGAMGEDTTITQFFLQADKYYLATKLFGTRKHTEFDWDDAINDIREKLLDDRKDQVMDKIEARKIWNEIQELSDVGGSTNETLIREFTDNDILAEWTTDCWECNWGFKPKSEYLALQDHIIPMIKDYFLGKLTGQTTGQSVPDKV